VLAGAASTGAGGDPRRARLVVLASGSGSTLQAVLDAAAEPDFPAEVVAAGTDVKGCPAMARAEDRGVPTFAVALRDHADRAAWNDAVAEQLAAFEPDLVVLAGFMRVLAPSVVRRFRIVNTHPAYLPAFPGAHAIRDALAARVDTTGVTVHWVDDGIDTGPVIAQQRVPIHPGDDEDSLRLRIQAVEKPLYVNAIRQISRTIVSTAKEQ
jgi:formyltetrahydrofolate-dependent phosphoribosylglycinamide formyltransferase